MNNKDEPETTEQLKADAMALLEREAAAHLKWSRAQDAVKDASAEWDLVRDRLSQAEVKLRRRLYEQVGGDPRCI